MKRIEFNRKTRALIIARAQGKCEVCSAVLKPGEAEVDHILPSALGGTAEAINGHCLCKVCHAAKTAKDVGRIRKADRQRDRASGAIHPKQTIKSAGFQKKEKPERKKGLPPRDIFGRGRLWTPSRNEDPD